MKLDEWTVTYVEHRALMEGGLDGHGRDGDVITFLYDDGSEKSYEVADILREADLESDVVVCLNTEANLTTLVDHWDNFVRADVQVIFANPERNEKWKVRPSVHEKVADPENLRNGLETLQSSVELVENN